VWRATQTFSGEIDRSGEFSTSSSGMAILNEASDQMLGQLHRLWRMQPVPRQNPLREERSSQCGKNQPFGAIGQIGPWNSGNRAR
jgi:hypothetical protein